jgi:hypothetical protein
MRDEIQCLLDWTKSILSDERAHITLRALAEESLKKVDLEEEKRRFTNKEIVAAAQVITNEPPNKWVNWNQRVLPYWNSRKNDVIALARKRGLNFYPELGFYIPEKAGRGNESLYWLKAEPLPEINDDEEEQKAKLEPISHQNENRIRILYERAENGEVKPAWGAKWLLHDGQIRLSIRHISVIIGSLVMLWGGAIMFSYFSWVTLSAPKPVTTRELTVFLSIFVVPYAIWILVIKPLMRLFEDRIVHASELLVDVNEKPSQLELFKDGDLRLISLVRYSAPCPICGATIYLDEGSPDFPRRMVGRCSESPREHLFSFDRVTRKGTVLRSPIV